MATTEITPRPAAAMQPPENLSAKWQLVLALTEMAVMRGGEWSKEALKIYSAELLKENADDVFAALALLGRTARDPHEPAIPDMGTILKVAHSVNHPLRHLREIVTRLALVFDRPCDEDLLQVFQDAAGHRTDADLDNAYRHFTRSAFLSKMPTTGQFLEACGTLRVRRDGSKPE